MTPWYRLHPGRAVMVAVGLFVGISILCWFVHGHGQATAILYLLPVALLAVAFGLRGGLLGATAGFSLFASLHLVQGGQEVPAVGWATRALAVFSLGVLLGRATDQTAANARTALEEQTERYRLEETNKRYAEATELSDCIIQHMVAAKWLAEQGRSDRAAEILEATIERGEAMIQGLLGMRASTPSAAVLADTGPGATRSLPSSIPEESPAAEETSVVASSLGHVRHNASRLLAILPLLAQSRTTRNH